MMVVVIIKVILVCLKLWLTIADSPHSPVKQTWVITNLETGEVVNSTESSSHPAGVWFPNLYVDLCDLVGKSWHPSSRETFAAYGCTYSDRRHNTRNTPFYVCPGHRRSPSQKTKCVRAGDAFCAAWGCESTGSIDWSPPRQDLITVKAYDRDMVIAGKCHVTGQSQELNCGPCYASEKGNYYCATKGGLCNGLEISFTEQGKKDECWQNGKSWGLGL